MGAPVSVGSVAVSVGVATAVVAASGAGMAPATDMETGDTVSLLMGRAYSRRICRAERHLGGGTGRNPPPPRPGAAASAAPTLIPPGRRKHRRGTHPTGPAPQRGIL